MHIREALRHGIYTFRGQTPRRNRLVCLYIMSSWLLVVAPIEMLVTVTILAEGIRRPEHGAILAKKEAVPCLGCMGCLSI